MKNSSIKKDKGYINRLTNKPNNEKFAQKQEEICHFVQHSHPEGWKTIFYSLQTRKADNQMKSNLKNKFKCICAKLYNHKHQVKSPDHVPHEEEEGVSGRRAKVFAINCHLETKHIYYSQIRQHFK